jgi:hypothetical protein
MIAMSVRHACWSWCTRRTYGGALGSSDIPRSMAEGGYSKTPLQDIKCTNVGTMEQELKRDNVGSSIRAYNSIHDLFTRSLNQIGSRPRDLP